MYKHENMLPQWRKAVRALLCVQRSTFTGCVCVWIRVIYSDLHLEGQTQIFTGVKNIVRQGLQLMCADGIQNPLPGHRHKAKVLVLTCQQTITLLY